MDIMTVSIKQLNKKLMNGCSLENTALKAEIAELKKAGE